MQKDYNRVFVSNANKLLATIDKIKFKKDVLQSEKAKYRLQADPHYLFFRECLKECEPDLPLLEMINDKQLAIMNYQLLPRHSKVLQAVLTSCKEQLHTFNSVILVNNRLTDQRLAEILEGLTNINNIQRFDCRNNEFGMYSIKHIAKLVSRPRPYQLRELSLANCKLSPDAFDELFEMLYAHSNLSKLSL